VYPDIKRNIMKTSRTNTTSNSSTQKRSSNNMGDVSNTSKEIKVELERKAIKNATAIENLKKLHPWPEEEPQVGHDWSGFFSNRHKDLFKKIITDKTEVVLELGSWLGKSSRFIAQTLPDNGIVICVDHWKGSPEFNDNAKLSGRIPTAFETFTKNQWGLKDKTIAIKDSTQDGIKSVQECGIEPDIIYVDAGHDYDNVSADIRKCIEVFPKAVLVMDDYSDKWPDVVKAVDEIAEEFKEYKKIQCRRICILSKVNLNL
jgi:hypothetical protein